MIIPIQALRLLMCIVIIADHYLKVCGYFHISVERMAIFSTSAFFMLSGFVLALVWNKRGPEPPGRFFVRRYLRLLPLNMVGVAAGALINPAVLTHIWSFTAVVLMFQSWIPDSGWYFAVNAPLWFLSDIVFCYAVFPFLIRGGKLVWMFIAAYGALLALWGGWYCPDELSNDFYYIPPWCRIVDFSLGILAFRVCMHVRHRLRRYGAAMLQVASLVLLVAAFVFADAAPGNLSEVSWWWIPVFFLVIAMALPGGVFGRLLGHPFWVVAGEYAFPLYVLHMPVLWGMGKLFYRLGIDASLPAIMAAAALLTLAAAWIVNRLVERPCASLLKRRFSVK